MIAPGASFDLVQTAFTAVTGPAHAAGAWTSFLCPAHDDHAASAGIKYDAEQRRTVVKCFAGCPDEAVLAALGLEVADLFDQPHRMPRHHDAPRRLSRSEQPKRRALGKQLGWPQDVAHYVYRGLDGHRVGRVIRTYTEHEHGPKKGFYQRHYDPITGAWPLGRFPALLYRLPEIAAAINAGRAVWVCEGEKDVERAVAVGLDATCNAGGAGKFTSAHAQQLAGARRVVIVADRDLPGLAHARGVRKLLTPLVAEVLVVQARDGKDFSDHVAAGHGLEDFDPVVELGYSGADIADLTEMPHDAQLRHLIERAAPASALAPMRTSQFTRRQRHLVAGRDQEAGL